MYEVLPGYQKIVGPCFTHQNLRKVTEILMHQLCKLVFPDYTVVLKGIEDPDQQIKVGRMELTREASFIEKINSYSEKYGQASIQTLTAVRRSIQLHEDKLRLINSKQFQFSQVANILDAHSEELQSKIRDTVVALQRRCTKVIEVEHAMALKIKTMLEQSIATLQIQAQPVAVLKFRCTQDLYLEKKKEQDWQIPEQRELSFYHHIIGFANYDSKWQWDFIYNDGSRTSP